MALTLPQILYGYVVTAGSNDKLDFIEAGVTRAATLSPGTYSAQGYAAEVQRAMRAIAGTTANTCVWAQSTRLFTLAGTATFSLLFSSNTGANYTTSCGNLLGFHVGAGASADDKTGSTSYNSTSAAGSGNSTATLWTLAEPHDYTSPVTASAVGTAATFTRRTVYGAQSVSDGATIESIYFSTLKWMEIGFNYLTVAEATKMEAFLSWAVKGQPFIWQPDATSGNGLILVADFGSSKAINGDYSWITRPEISYGRLRFFEDTTR